MTRNRILFPMILALLLCPLTQANAQTDAQVEEAIQVMISNRHPSDTAATWQGLGANAPRVIISMYQKTENVYQRLRLLHGLGWFNDPIAVDFLKQQALDSEQDVIRNQAIRAVGTSQGAKEADFVGKFLSNKDAQTRIAAAETLKAMNDPRSTQMVEKYLSEEKASWIVQKIKGQIAAPTAMLKPVSSSEDRLNSQFVGIWKGFWVAPVRSNQSSEKENKGGMSSLQAVFRLEIDSAQEISGDLMIQSKSKSQIWVMKRAEGKASRLKGVFLERAIESQPRPKSGQAPVPEVSFEADLTEESEVPLIRLRVPKLGATLVVRKSQ